MALNVSDEVDSRNVSSALILISTFYSIQKFRIRSNTTHVINLSPVYSGNWGGKPIVGATSEVGTAYPSGVHEITPVLVGLVLLDL